ncbi:RNA polymerase sigma-70 factor, ECF subfamily [Azotobacter beijerinckii]|uniref:RNA polymerase sigma-70 factor, ECF subfamily n=1 Tax=Azotobacter beijerinckii TaxID=170623 RepID=A0A1H8ZK62_9GAMM|nr:RNA polymerase sigma-70 factor, ECF subfamily [Azotobacter beijerinckii]SEJ54724.1 RNA polymerase sigma-70 factor, ECF subfamily [Azotobacter beijerinckii]SEP64677.1 RNA polymerase sigma-70 factor, ECF subfamily [Azotobacter beijerinckii]
MAAATRLPAFLVLNADQSIASRYDPKELSDEELVERAHAELFHITRAYAELMQRYQRTLFNVCARYLGNERDADDVCQEVMLKVLYGLRNFEGKSKFKTWLYSITYNECITQYRKERRKRRLMDALSLDPLEEASEEKAPKLEERGGLDRWLVHVNSIDREILVLRFVAELEFQEIADIMHMGLSATKMRYKRALDRLREKFSGLAEP